MPIFKNLKLEKRKDTDLEINISTQNNKKIIASSVVYKKELMDKIINETLKKALKNINAAKKMIYLRL